ncbi:MAG: OmpA family protein, partial [Thermodesulfobacteriota bacterium]
VARWLKERSSVKVRIQGHCDERGSNEYNIALGERRANSVRNYLTTLGVSPSRISTVTFGEEQPVCGEHNEGCWWKNRRGETEIVSR